jgi:predicted MPP superfamily phosphohydrolase
VFVDPVALFRILAVATLLGVPLYAGYARGRVYAIFGFSILALSLPGAWVSQTRLVEWAAPALRPWIGAAFAYGVAAAALHLGHLVRARLRSRWFRAALSLPGQTFVAAGFMAGAWLLLLLPVRLALHAAGWDGALDALRWLDLAPYVVAVASVATSIKPAIEWVRFSLGGDGPPEVARVPVERHRGRPPAPLARRPLRIVQIADPHLGPWQSSRRLRETLASLLAQGPDLVLLTGDFLTMEGQGSPGALRAALDPLRGVSERCFAIFGNHDHEAADEVREALAHNGVRLLVDEEVLFETPVGPVQILGADYIGRGRRAHLAALLARYPRRPHHLRLLLLHDPLGFQYLPDGAVDLTLSGHTHGGQVGLVSLGFDWTVLSRSAWPDHGLFARGSNRLYVHRGIGFYGFPMRVGVPGEQSVLEVVI